MSKPAPDPGPEAVNAEGDRVPLLEHALDAETVFSPLELIRSVRARRALPGRPPPEVCVLDFDGDLTDALVRDGEAELCPEWACFHTSMWTILEGPIRCGIIARTIGGPYAVLVAEQLAASGVRVILGLASAGRIDPGLPLPALVAADRAIRDEGTSFHYLPPAESVSAWPGVAEILADELRPIGWESRIGSVWTTDAPYRETAEQVGRHRAAGVLAVEMQAASLFAFSARMNVPVGLVAHLTNAPEVTEPTFDKGTMADQRRIVEALARAGRRIAAANPPRRFGPHGGCFPPAANL
jgi:uridine phosphorylase